MVDDGNRPPTPLVRCTYPAASARATSLILGHESPEMVKRYLSLAQMDLEKAHQDASPVANWLL